MKEIMILKKIKGMKMNKKLTGSIGVIVVLAAFLGWTLSNQGTEAAVAEAVRGGIEKYVEEVGEVRCSDATTVYLEGSGRIVDIAVEEGQHVRKGDLLLSMDQAQLEIALKNAEETLNEAMAQYSAGEKAYRTVMEDYNKTKFLANEGALSLWELTQKEAELKRAEAVRAGHHAVLEQAELNLQNRAIELSKQQILSPADGKVLEKNVELNELGVPGTAAFVIGNDEYIEIETRILADRVTEVKAGDPAEIIIRTKEKTVLRGEVTKIAPTATDETSSLGVKQKRVAVTIKPLKHEASLRPGSEADVKVITEIKDGVIIVPAGAVFDYQGSSCVFAVKSGKAVIIPVDTGIRNGSYVEIKKGVTEGEIVLSAPDNSIEEGMRIRTLQETKRML